jgi:hypothetical protein
MQIKHKIVKIEVTGLNETKVWLEDGSELIGISRVNALADTTNLSTVAMTAYIYSDTGVLYENIKTKERINIKAAEHTWFFANRNKADWKRADV